MMKCIYQGLSGDFVLVSIREMAKLGCIGRFGRHVSAPPLTLGSARALLGYFGRMHWCVRMAAIILVSFNILYICHK